MRCFSGSIYFVGLAGVLWVYLGKKKNTRLFPKAIIIFIAVKLILKKVIHIFSGVISEKCPPFEHIFQGYHTKMPMNWIVVYS